MIDLDWVPKSFGPGDIAGEGTNRLLGTSVPPASLLVRETAQNSWDARLPDGVPEYQLRFRRLSARTLRTMSEHVFRETAPSGRLLSDLAESSLDAIEVLDRGTTGLGGPTQNDMPSSGTSNYRDFILTVGAPRDNEYGGGTYGFGKSAVFRASSCGTIIVWTRIRSDGGDFEERFIAAAVNPNFADRGVRYTGQQWWGHRHDGHAVASVEPVTGKDAHELGSCLFERGFLPDETGTSIMILAPSYDTDRADFISDARGAITQNLWAKMISPQSDERRMQLTLTENGVVVPLIEVTESPVLTAKAQCLSAVRAADDHAGEVPFGVIPKEIWCHSPKRLLGHLALSPYWPGDDPFADLGNRITFMRNQAELVVEDREYPRLENGRDFWVGVFKPTLEMDSCFSEAEPPTHDTWNPSSLRGRGKTFVNVALKRIADSLKEYLNPPASDSEAEDQVSTGELAERLSVLTYPIQPPDNGTKATGPSRRRSPGRPNTMKPKVEVLSHTLLPEAVSGGAEPPVTRITLVAHGSSAHVWVSARLSALIDGNTAVSDPDIYVRNWSVSRQIKHGTDGVVVSPEEEFSADICYPPDVAVDCAFLGEDTQ